jgi:V8-like Glu-specific endopeptidase
MLLRAPRHSAYEAMLNQLRLPPPIAKLLTGTFEEIGAPLEERTSTDAAGRQLRFDHANTEQGGYALIHIPTAVMEHEFELVADCGNALTPNVGSIFIFSEARNRDPRLEETRAYWCNQGLKRAEFFFYDQIRELELKTDPAERKELLREWFRLPRPQAVDGVVPCFEAPATPLAIEHVERLVQELARHADSQQIGQAAYFRLIVNSTHMPVQTRASLLKAFSDSSDFNARVLVHKALNGSMAYLNPMDNRYTLLGSLLHKALPRLNPAAAALAVAMITYYGLIRDPTLINLLSQQYQVPQQAGHTEQGERERTPWLEWCETKEETELQSFLHKEDPLLEISDLMGAIEQVGSVCYIEVPRIRRYGTGVLVALDLVLTNMHVLLDDWDISEHDQRSAAQRNAESVILRFRWVTASEGEQEQGRKFRLAEFNPLVRCSPIRRLDYALLRVEPAIRHARGIAPAKYENVVPDKKSALHILQHAPHKALRVCFSPNGVTSIHEDRGLIQYITYAVHGSSGSPCFNRSWKVVALHHAEQDYTLYRRREGILFRCILGEIASDLERYK